MPTVEAISAERVIEDARSERMAREARKRREAASDPDGSQRAKRRAMGHWRSNAGMVQFDAALMTDAELAWFSTIDQARKNADDALRLRDLRATLLQRSSNQRLQQWEEERRGNAERLKRLGLSDDGREGGAAA